MAAGSGDSGFRLPVRMNGLNQLGRTCLSAGVVERGRGLDGHGVDGTVADLGAGIASAARPRHLLRLGRLAAEVAAAHHLLRGGLAPESAGDQDLLRCGRLSPVTKTSTAANQITSAVSMTTNPPSPTPKRNVSQFDYFKLKSQEFELLVVN